MRLKTEFIVEDVTMQDLRDLKVMATEANVIVEATPILAISKPRSGIIPGIVTALLLTGAALTLLFALTRGTPSNHQIGGQTVAPPLVETGPIGVPGLPPGVIPPLPPAPSGGLPAPLVPEPGK